MKMLFVKLAKRRELVLLSILSSLSFFISLLFTLPNVGLTPPGHSSQIPVGQMPIWGATDVDQNTRQIHKGGPPWVWSKHNVSVSARDNTGQDTDVGHTPSPRIEIKISAYAGNRTQIAGQEGRDSTDHATATEKYFVIIWNTSEM